MKDHEELSDKIKTVRFDIDTFAAKIRERNLIRAAQNNSKETKNRK